MTIIIQQYESCASKALKRFQNYDFPQEHFKAFYTGMCGGNISGWTALLIAYLLVQVMAGFIGIVEYDEKFYYRWYLLLPGVYIGQKLGKWFRGKSS